MIRFLFVTLATFVLTFLAWDTLYTGEAQAEPSKPTISVVKEGQPAPYSGILLNNQAYAIIQSELEYSDKPCEARCEFETKRLKETCEFEKTEKKIACEKEANVCQETIKKCQVYNSSLLDIIKKLPEPIVLEDKSERPWLILTGVGVGAVIATVSTYFIMKNK